MQQTGTQFELLNTKEGNKVLYEMHTLLFLFLTLNVLFSVGSQICSDLLGDQRCSLLPPDDQCGTARVSARVVGGQDAGVAQFPWVTLLLSLDKINPRKYTICTGSIISETYVITAGHCCLDKKIQLLRIGEYDLGTLNSCTVDGVTLPPPSDPVMVHNYTVHPEFSPDTLQNDLCLIQLDNPIPFNECVSPICLPISEIFMNNDLALYSMEVAGWGAVGEYADGKVVLPEHMQTLTLPVVPLSMCQWMLELLNFNITDHQLCAGGVPGRNICQGDSGAPLMAPLALDQRPSAYYLIGVASFTQKNPCAQKLPSVYVNVSKYLKWIVSNLKL